MICDRCGIEIDFAAYHKRKKRGTANGLCNDCNAKPSKAIKYNKEKCRPWVGEVNENWEPIDKKGEPYLPGNRTCGHKDCVNQSHIINPLDIERLDISYRTGKVFDLRTLLKEAS